MLSVLLLFGLIGTATGMISGLFGHRDTLISKTLSATVMGTALVTCIVAYLHVNIWAACAVFGGFVAGAGWGENMMRESY